MKSDTKNTSGWSAAKKELNGWEKSALLTLVKDLYDSSSANRDFIQARCAPGDAALESYRKKIVQQFFPARGEAKLKLGEARKAIREYARAAGDPVGTAELLMTYVENGAEFTHLYGDIDERFYSSIESALDELARLLRGEARGLYPQLGDRLSAVEYMIRDVGWGFYDYVSDVIGQLEGELG